MDPRISVITLAVSDLKKSVAFYRDGLGFPTDANCAEYDGGPEFFFPLNDHLILVLLSRLELAKDAKVAVSPPSPAEMCLGHIVESKEKVDAILSQAESAGACVTNRPRDRSWGGYSGFFQDPDGHLWEIIWSPIEESSE